MYWVYPVGPNYVSSVWQNVIAYNAATFVLGQRSVTSGGNLSFTLNFPVTINPYNNLPAVIGIDLYSGTPAPLTTNRLILDKDCKTVRTSYPE